MQYKPQRIRPEPTTKQNFDLYTVIITSALNTFWINPRIKNNTHNNNWFYHIIMFTYAFLDFKCKD